MVCGSVVALVGGVLLELVQGQPVKEKGKQKVAMAGEKKRM